MKFKKLDKKTKEEVKHAVRILRFHTVNPKVDSPRFMEYKAIARELGITYN